MHSCTRFRTLHLVYQPLCFIPMLFCIFFSSHHHQFVMLFILCSTCNALGYMACAVHAMPYAMLYIPYSTSPYSVCLDVYFLLCPASFRKMCCMFPVLNRLILLNILFLTLHYSVPCAVHCKVFAESFCMPLFMF